MRLVCLECKNEVDLSNYPDLDTGHVVECDTCGITLMIKDLDDDIKVEIVDEGK